MILDRHKLQIIPVSEEQYWRFKGKQKLAPKPDYFGDVQTLYAMIKETFILTPRQLANEIETNLKGIEKIARLLRPKRKGKKPKNVVHLWRRTIYETGNEPSWNSIGQLETMIEQGRGLDLVLNYPYDDEKPANHKFREEHYYRLIGEEKRNVYLVQVQIPNFRIYEDVSSTYTFTDKIGKGVDRIQATHVMPEQFIQEEFENRKQLRKGI